MKVRASFFIALACVFTLATVQAAEERRLLAGEAEELGRSLWTEVERGEEGVSGIGSLLSTIPDGPEKRAAINKTRGEHGFALLHEAVRRGSVAMVAALIQAGADVHVRTANRYAWTPLHFAFNRQIAALLIDAGADVNAEDAYGNTLLKRLLESRYGDDWDECHRATFDYLIAKGAAVNTGRLETPLAIAVKNNLKACVRVLLAQGAVLNRTCLRAHGQTVLHLAADQCLPQMISLLVAEYGFDVNAQSLSEGHTPLHSVVAKGPNYFHRLPPCSYDTWVQTVQALLDNGANINEPDSSGKTALHIAAEQCLPGMVTYQVERGAQIDAETAEGRTPLHVAVSAECSRSVKASKDTLRSSWAQTVQALLASGASLDERDSSGNTVLHVATMHWQSLMVQYLIDQGAPLDARDADGKTPLHLAVMRKRPYNADTSIGMRCYRDEQWVQTVQTLVDKGADVNVLDGASRAVLFDACSNVIGGI